MDESFCDIDWTRFYYDPDDVEVAGLKDRDLHGQGLTRAQIDSIADVPLTGSYL
ncbi:hypothetical protein ACFYOF_16835 [Streptomyces sp. NPDC007148]|uniref:hypothetical protein n=1 Tax=Streptomyces sp. NPDC007148 TaxID=3364775 RepID=UPI0036C26B3D